MRTSNQTGFLIRRAAGPGPASKGLSVALNIHSSIDGNDPRFAAVNATAGGLISNGGTNYVFDWSNPGHLKAELDLHTPFEQQGVRQ